MITALDNLNKNRDAGKYPFTSNSTLQSKEGIIIPNESVLDASFYPTGEYETIRIGEIDKKLQGSTIKIYSSYDKIGEGNLDDIDDKIIKIKDNYNRDIGIIVIDETFLFFIKNLKPNQYYFDLESAVFLPSCITIRPNSFLEGFTDENGNIVSGEVWLVGEAGVFLNYTQDSSITINCIGDPLFKTRFLEKTADYMLENVPIKEIIIKNFNQMYYNSNKVKPDKYGNILLSSRGAFDNKSILKIRPTENGIKMEILNYE